tara:strand:+ start:10475 stop:10930 length:456 start_codon:yes stop_codon:yes gene_type:complete
MGPYDGIGFATLILSYFGLILLIICLVVMVIYALIRKTRIQDFLIYAVKFSVGFIVLFYTLLLSFLYWSAYETDSPRRESMQAVEQICIKHGLTDYRINDSHYYFDNCAHRGEIIFFSNPLDSSVQNELKKLGNVTLDSLENQNAEKYWCY